MIFFDANILPYYFSGNAKIKDKIIKATSKNLFWGQN
jgi:hypothetical protein